MKPMAIKNRALISVIIPIFCIEKYLGICIESVLNQSYGDLEIILVDDGSPDRCPEICDLYASKDKRIKVIHKKNGGLVSARKAGLLAATGYYVTYVDGDDWIEKGYYEWLIREIGDADIVIAGHSRTLFNKTVHLTNSLPAGEYDGDSLKDLFARMISNGAFYKPGVTTYVWNKLFKRDMLMKHQMAVNDMISIGEDAAVVYPLLFDCKKVVITDNCDYHYRQREDSMLKKSKPFSEEVAGLKRLYNHLISFAENTPEPFHMKEQVNDFLLGICFMRSGCIETGNSLLLPFEKDFKGKRLAIYSAGTFGQQLVNRITEYDYATVVKWVDDDYWEYRRCCLNVDPVSELTSASFDYLLIATVDRNKAAKIQNDLVGLGINRKKVLVIQAPFKKEALLKKFFQ